MKKNFIEQCVQINIRKHLDFRGALGILEESELPFNIKRIFYISNIPEGIQRGGHAVIDCTQLLVPIKGSFTLLIDDGFIKKEIQLSCQKDFGILVPPLIWREMYNFQKDSVLLVVASMEFNEKNYIRDYLTYIETIRA